jgi:hypothetical protein
MTESIQPTSAGDVKQRILRIYNAVNQSISGVGVRQQQVHLLGHAILVIAEHRRIPALAVLDSTYRTLTRQVDVALVDLYKEALKEELEVALGVGVRTILRDYDPVTQLACSLIILETELPLGIGNRRAPTGER